MVCWVESWVTSWKRSNLSNANSFLLLEVQYGAVLIDLLRVVLISLRSDFELITFVLTMSTGRGQYSYTYHFALRRTHFHCATTADTTVVKDTVTLHIVISIFFSWSSFIIQEHHLLWNHSYSWGPIDCQKFAGS